MKTLLIAASLAIFGSAALADPIEGIWQTKTEDNGTFGHVEIKPCGPAFCGVLITAFNAEGLAVENPNLGRPIVWDMVAYPDGLYDDGQIYSPDRDKTYAGEMTLAGDSLKVRGCVLGVCLDGGTWVRVK